MNSNIISRTLNVADVIITVLILTIVVVVIYLIVKKDDSYVRILGHRNGIIVFESLDDKLYRMDSSDSLLNAIKRHAPLESAENLTFYFVHDELAKGSLDSLLNGNTLTQVQIDLMLQYEKEGSSLKLISAKTTRNTKETRNEMVLL